MPSHPTVLRWVAEGGEFSDNYAQARIKGYQVMADLLVDVALDTRAETARSRLIVDTYKWMLAKALPKIYGDRQKIEHDGGVVVKIVTGIPEGGR